MDMSEVTPPQKGVQLTYTERDIGFGPMSGEPDERDGERVIGGQKFFTDPHNMAFALLDKSLSEVRWTLATSGPDETLLAIADVLAQGDFEEGRGTIALANDKKQQAQSLFLPGNKRVVTIVGGETIQLKGDAVDIAAKVLADPGLVRAFLIANKHLAISWGYAWQMSFHDISSCELRIREKRPDSLARYVVDQCVAVTAGDEVKASIDETLDEMGEYIPSFAR